MQLFGTNRALLEMLEEYLAVCDQVMAEFVDAIAYLVDHRVDDHFDTLCDRVHQRESDADDIRRRIEQEMYSKSLLPETQEDLFTILEKLDKVPNQCQQVVYSFSIMRVRVPKALRDELLELLSVSRRAFANVLEATRDCFGTMSRVKVLAREVDHDETLGDHIEREMLRRLFAGDQPMADKLLYRELILEIAKLCDLCETAMDRVTICSIKRQV